MTCWGFGSDVVEIVTSETESEPRPGSNFETRPRLCHKIRDRDRDLEVRDRDSRPHIFMMIIQDNSLNNAAAK